VCKRLNDAGWGVANADVTIMAERPRLGPFREAMVEAMSRLAEGVVNVKFGTNEQCDAVGRGEAVAAHAVVLVAKLPESAQ
jgi:2-C-methyl-D-erythritol 2,4-cyclodiphosphate synthase